MNDCTEIRSQSVLEALYAEGALSVTMARYYNPTIGRFVSEDPLRFTLADIDKAEAFQVVMTLPMVVPAYRYANNLPVLLKDPFGLSAGGVRPPIPMPDNCQLALTACRRITDRCKEIIQCIYNQEPEKFPDLFGSADLGAVLFKQCNDSNFSVCKLAYVVCIIQRIINIFN